jgi:hypothetical protein
MSFDAAEAGEIALKLLDGLSFLRWAERIPNAL